MMQTMIVSDFKPILTKCFAEDFELIEKWHLRAGFGLEICVDQTFNDMKEAGVECHVVYEERELIGYFGKEKAHGQMFLTGFFVMPEYRTKEDLIEFWALIKKELGPMFYCGLYAKNQPAIDFITRNNAEPKATFNHEGEGVVVYKVEVQPCQ